MKRPIIASTCKIITTRATPITSSTELCPWSSARRLSPSWGGVPDAATVRSSDP